MHVLIVDDHGLFRAGLEQLLRSLEPQINIASVPNFAALKPQTNYEFDLVLLDYHIPGDDPLQNIRSARATFLASKIVLVSAETDSAKIVTAIELGASGFIPKRADSDILIGALKLVLAGGIYLPSEISQYYKTLYPDSYQTLDERSSNNGAADRGGGCAESSTTCASIDDLSSRQKQVLKLAINGLSNQQISNKLNISVDTVKAHLSRAYRTLGIHSRTQAVLLSNDINNLK